MISLGGGWRELAPGAASMKLAAQHGHMSMPAIGLRSSRRHSSRSLRDTPFLPGQSQWSDGASARALKQIQELSRGGLINHYFLMILVHGRDAHRAGDMT